MPPTVVVSGSDSEEETAVQRRGPNTVSGTYGNKSNATGKGKSNAVTSNSKSNTDDGKTKDSGDALRAAQAENFRLRMELKNVKLEANSREVEAPKRRGSSKMSIKGSSGDPNEPPDPGHTDNNIVDSDSEISKHGRKYSHMVCPWIDASVFDNLIGRPNVDPLSDERYNNKASRLAGTIAELYDFVPEKLHKLMENHSRFVTTFRQSLQSARSNAILAVRQRAGFLYGMEQQFFETSYDRGSLPQFQALLKAPKDDSYSLFAPILFEGQRYDPTMKKLFKNSLLPRISKIMLFGKSSTTKSKPQTLAEIWKVTTATPGLIAFTAILARFLLSPEEELRQVGKVTKIQWLNDFNDYKRMLSSDTKKVRAIFDFFNEIAFGITPVSNTNPADAKKDNKEDLEDAMRLMAMDDSFDDEDESESMGPVHPSDASVKSDSLSDPGEISFIYNDGDDLISPVNKTRNGGFSRVRKSLNAASSDELSESQGMNEDSDGIELIQRTPRVTSNRKKPVYIETEEVNDVLLPDSQLPKEVDFDYASYNHELTNRDYTDSQCGAVYLETQEQDVESDRESVESLQNQSAVVDVTSSDSGSNGKSAGAGAGLVPKRKVSESPVSGLTDNEDGVLSANESRAEVSGNIAIQKTSKTSDRRRKKASDTSPEDHEVPGHCLSSLHESQDPNEGSSAPVNSKGKKKPIKSAVTVESDNAATKPAIRKSNRTVKGDSH